MSKIIDMEMLLPMFREALDSYPQDVLGTTTAHLHLLVNFSSVSSSPLGYGLGEGVWVNVAITWSEKSGQYLEQQQ